MAEEESQPSAPLEVNASIKNAITSTSNQVRERAEDFSSLYANNMAVGYSQWDMHVIFGEIVGQREGKPVIEEFTKITMTREVAKVFAHVLMANIAKYETQFGEIAVPANLKLEEIPDEQLHVKTE